jgi:hypothetical protein
MTLKEGAENEINSRWPEHKQRNTALYPEWYGKNYKSATSWSTTQAMRDLLDKLAEI